MAELAYKYEPIEEETASNLAPDDSGEVWKHPVIWQENPDAIHELVMNEVGSDFIKPRGFQVLIKLWTPPSQNDFGWDVTDQDKRSEMQQCTIGKILRMGSEAFIDPKRFPCGPRVTYGEWGIFRGSERQKVSTKDGVMLALVNEDRFMAVTNEPDEIITGFNIEQEWRDH